MLAYVLVCDMGYDGKEVRCCYLDKSKAEAEAERLNCDHGVSADSTFLGWRFVVETVALRD